MSYEDRRTARRDKDGVKYLTDTATLDWTRPPDVWLVHKDGRQRVLFSADLIALTRAFHNPSEAVLEAEIERLLLVS